MASIPETMALTTIKAPMAASKRNDSTIFFKDGCLGDKPINRVKKKKSVNKNRETFWGLICAVKNVLYIYLQASEDCQRWQSFVLQSPCLHANALAVWKGAEATWILPWNCQRSWISNISPKSKTVGFLRVECYLKPFPISPSDGKKECQLLSGFSITKSSPASHRLKICAKRCRVGLIQKSEHV